MSLINARQALRTRLLAWTGLDSQNVAYEGLLYTPVPNTAYLREVTKIGASLLQSLGPLGRIRTRGLYLLDYFGPSGKGTKDADTYADNLMAWFPPNLQLTIGGQTVTIESTSRAGAILNAPWVQIPVSLTFYFDAFNSI